MDEYQNHSLEFMFLNLNSQNNNPKSIAIYYALESLTWIYVRNFKSVFVTIQPSIKISNLLFVRKVYFILQNCYYCIPLTKFSLLNIFLLVLFTCRTKHLLMYYTPCKATLDHQTSTQVVSSLQRDDVGISNLASWDIWTDASWSFSLTLSMPSTSIMLPFPNLKSPNTPLAFKVSNILNLGKCVLGK